jgi:hypothetical protein
MISWNVPGICTRSCHCCGASKLRTWLSWACRRSIWKGMQLRQRTAWRGALTMPLRTCEMHGTALVVVRSIDVCTPAHQLLDLRFTGECQHPACWSPSQAMLAELMLGVHTPPQICAVCDAGRLASGYSPISLSSAYSRESWHIARTRSSANYRGQGRGPSEVARRTRARSLQELA